MQIAVQWIVMHLYLFMIVLQGYFSNSAFHFTCKMGQMKGVRIELGDITQHNIKQLKRLNQYIFPVSYNDKFYKDVLEVGDLAKLAFFNDVVVGAVCCRVDMLNGERKLYIMTLGCLAPYRRHGIGTVLLDHVFKICEDDGKFEAIFLHVQINNDSAINFYKHFGFEIKETKERYYKRIEPSDAFVLEKRLNKWNFVSVCSW